MKVIGPMTLLLTLLVMLAPCTSARSKQRPNIIYIMADDLGFGDLSSFGCRDYQTPNIDAFIKEGLKFNNAYAGAPVCTPTRVAFMTGRFPARNIVGLREPLTGSAFDEHLGLSTSIPTISSILKHNGYETALFGKWHLGLTDASFPLKHGFDHFFGILSGAADYIDHRTMDRNGPILFKRGRNLLYENGVSVKKSGYLTDVITDYATRFISQKHEKPFFISIQYTTPHWPWQSPDDKQSPDTVYYAKSGDAETYSKMVRNLDDNFGKILEAVRLQGLDKSTMIIFTSDNGGDRLSNMGPYKGAKLQLWEGGIRVPAAVWWPGQIRAGIESDQPVITMDWTVTILDASRSKYSDSLRFDGISLLPHFQRPDKMVERTFYWRTSNRAQASALRKGVWKYLKTSEGEFLFNLRDDPYEEHDLSKAMGDQLKALRAEFLALNSEMLDPVLLGN